MGRTSIAAFARRPPKQQQQPNRRREDQRNVHGNDSSSVNSSASVRVYECTRTSTSEVECSNMNLLNMEASDHAADTDAGSKWLSISRSQKDVTANEDGREDGNLDDTNSNASAEVEDYDLGIIDDIACGLYEPLSKMWGVKSIAGIIAEQADANPQTDADINGNSNSNNNNEDTNGQKRAEKKPAANSSLLDYSDSDNGNDKDSSRRSNSSFSDSGDAGTSTSTSISIDIDVSADLDEIEQRQGDLLKELTKTKEELLQEQKENQTEDESNGRFKMGLRIPSFHGRSKRGISCRNKGKSGMNGSSDCSDDRAVLAVVNARSCATSKGGGDATKTVDSSTNSAALRPEGLNSSTPDLVVETTATATATTATDDGSGTAGKDGATTTTTTATLHSTDATSVDRLGSLVSGVTAQAQHLIKAMQEDAQRFYQEAIAAEQGGDMKGAQKWYGLVSMAQVKEDKTKTEAEGEDEQSFVAPGLEVKMTPSTDGRSVASVTVEDEEGTAGSIAFNVAGDAKDIVSKLGLGASTSFGGEAGAPFPAPAPSHVCSSSSGVKVDSTSVTVDDPTFLLEISSIDGMAASFSADVKAQASQQPSMSNKKLSQHTSAIGDNDDEPPLDPSEFVTPVANLLERAYGTQMFGGSDRRKEVNLILDKYKGREDTLIQSLLLKLVEREAMQKKQQGGFGDKSGVTDATPADSFNLDVSSIHVDDADVDTTGAAPEVAPTSSPYQAPPNADLSFQDLPIRPFDDAGIDMPESNGTAAPVGSIRQEVDNDDDDSIFADLGRDQIETTDKAGKSFPSLPTTGNFPRNNTCNVSSPPSKSTWKVSSPKTPSTVEVHSDLDCSPGNTSGDDWQGGSMQSDGSSNAFDFGNFASSNPFRTLNFANYDVNMENEPNDRGVQKQHRQQAPPSTCMKVRCISNHVGDANDRGSSRSSPPFNSDSHTNGVDKFGYNSMHEHAGSWKSGGFASMEDNQDGSSPVEPTASNQRRAGRASTRLRSILQGNAPSVNAEVNSLIHQ